MVRRLALTLLAAAAPALLDTGCAAGPNAAEITEIRNAAAAYALTERATVLNLAKRCRFDPTQKLNLEKPARDAMQSWTERNGSILAAVDAYLVDYLAVSARRSGRSKAKELVDDLTRGYSDRGQIVAKQMIDDLGGRGACTQVLAEITQGLDIRSTEFDETLQGMVERYAKPLP